MKSKMIYQMAKSYLKVRLFNIPSPISIGINITNQCPKYCCYCDARNAIPNRIPITALFPLLEEIKKAGVCRVGFNGGDPPMHPHFKEIMEKAKKLDFYITVSVRETLIKKNIEALKNANLVFVSFDGKKEHHDRQKGKDSFKDLIPAFDALKANGIPFQTTTVLTKINKDDVKYIAEMAKKYGSSAHFQPLQFPPFKKVEHHALNLKHPLAPLMPSKEDYTKIGNLLLKLKKEGYPIATSKRIIKLLFIDWPDPEKTFLSYKLDKSIKCWAGLLYTNISEDGSLFPCTYYNPAYFKNCPNVFEWGFKRAVKEGMKLVDGSCQTCLVPCFMELNAMFSLDFKTILNWLPKVFK